MRRWRQGLYIQIWDDSRAFQTSLKTQNSASEWSDATCMAINQTHLVRSPKIQRQFAWLIGVLRTSTGGGEGQGQEGMFQDSYFLNLPSDVRIFRQ